MLTSRCLYSVLIGTVLISPNYAQKAVKSLRPSHRAALAKYLNLHKNCDFMPESAFDEAYGKGTFADLKKDLKGHIQSPYYFVGDFNHDKREDFAMLLYARISGVDTYRIVIWNGTKSGYRVAWEDAQSNGFFMWTWDEKKPRLVFGQPYSDDGFIISPAGDSYIPEQQSHSANWEGRTSSGTLRAP